ncbi:MAG TPA: hypothetical protein VM871_09435 [Flavisolibacter sp.]|nr:hypothetical protein [Flavisolibacter sp.]
MVDCSGGNSTPSGSGGKADVMKPAENVTNPVKSFCSRLPSVSFVVKTCFLFFFRRQQGHPTHLLSIPSHTKSFRTVVD